MKSLDRPQRDFTGRRELATQKVDRVLRQATNLVRIGRQDQVVAGSLVQGVCPIALDFDYII
jgi:hypothetical protein